MTLWTEPVFFLLVNSLFVTNELILFIKWAFTTIAGERCFTFTWWNVRFRVSIEMCFSTECHWTYFALKAFFSSVNPHMPNEILLMDRRKWTNFTTPLLCTVMQPVNMGLQAVSSWKYFLTQIAREGIVVVYGYSMLGQLQDYFRMTLLLIVIVEVVEC